MRASRLAALIVAVAALVRLALATVVPLFPDETYYWEWSRHLAAGYFDHPPAIAILIRAGTIVFGDTALGVRAGVVLAGAIMSWALVTLARDLDLAREGDAGAGRPDAVDLLHSPTVRTALFASIIPVALVGFAIATPDAPLLATTAVALVALSRALAAPPRSRQSLGWWIAAGIMLGLGFCSKYTAVLLPLGVLVALLARASLRRRLAEPGPYVATIVAVLVVSPTLIWNARHAWVSFAFQLHHGLGTPHGSPVGRELSLVGGQLGLITPILAVLAVIAVVRALRHGSDDRRFLLATVATVVIAFFAISAIRKPVEANWPAPAFVAAIPLLAFQPSTRRWRGWLVGGLALAAVVSVLVIMDALANIFPVPPRRDPLARAQGWRDLASAVTRARETLPPACSATWIAADRYQDASELAFHLPAHPRVFSLNLGSRANQYDLWPQLASLAAPSDCVLLVVDDAARGAGVVQRVHADRATLLTTAELRWDDAIVARRAIWLLQGIPAPGLGTAFSPSVPVRAALDSLVAAFPARASELDSVVDVFRHGPAPYLVAAVDTGPPVSNSDRRAAIARRIAQLHALLARTGAASVHRDERYPQCTFVRVGTRDSAAIGYVLAAQGCALAQQPRDDRVWSVRAGPAARAPGDSAHGRAGRRLPAIWLVYAAR